MIRLERLQSIAETAGDKIKGVQETGDLTKDRKADDSPVTNADLTASDYIRERLLDETQYTYVDEEHGVTDHDTDKWWLVDPLDGTKEFMRGSTEYTVNIALIDDDTPVLGVVHAPATNTTYTAHTNTAWCDDTELHIKPVRLDDAVVAVSKSHPDDELDAFLQDLQTAGRRGIGSSLKGCHLAENTVHLYPRFQSLYGWDVAAMHAVIRGAGGIMQGWDTTSLTYSYETPRIKPFIAGHTDVVTDAQAAWQDHQDHPED
jgi:3'(2'), 5'-bisphosphate nucleotidase